jgi:hypothetical protein
MSGIEKGSVPLGESLRRHVLDPITTAESILENEYEEVHAEQTAFKRFKGEVDALETVSNTSAVPTTRVPLRTEHSCATKRVRTAYRETVMSVDHYDDVYGESLVEHVTAELSKEIAAELQADAHLQFTPLFKRTLLAAINSAIDRRETLRATLNDERNSLTRNRDALFEIVDELDGTGVPSSVGADFTDTLDDIAHQRQETLVTRTTTPRADGHDLCGYLYENCSWTYPVLTAVARLRRAVSGM